MIASCMLNATVMYPYNNPSEERLVNVFIEGDQFGFVVAAQDSF